MAWFLVAVLTLSAVVASWKGTRIAIPVAAVLVAAWAAAAIAIGTDYRDADGFMDCWPGCTALQNVAGFVFFVSPAMLVVLSASRLAAWLTNRNKR